MDTYEIPLGTRLPSFFEDSSSDSCSDDGPEAVLAGNQLATIRMLIDATQTRWDQVQKPMSGVRRIEKCADVVDRNVCLRDEEQQEDVRNDEEYDRRESKYSS